MFIILCLVIYPFIIRSNAFRLTDIKKLFIRDVPSNAFNRSIHDKIYLGSTVKIPCYTSEKPPRSSATYKWENLDHSNQEFNDNPRHTVDSDGILVIRNVSIEDAGVYVCTEYSKDTVLKMKHEVDVLQLPYLQLSVIIAYRMLDCKYDDEIERKKLLERKMKDGICRKNECKLGQIHSSCYNGQVSAFQITIPVVFQAFPSKGCGIECSRKKNENISKRVTRYILRSFFRNVNSKTKRSTGRVPFFKKREKLICENGFELQRDDEKRTACVPCRPGFFLNNGYCIPCRLNHYSEKFAATNCNACSGNMKTKTRRSRSKRDCSLAQTFPWHALLLILPALAAIIAGLWFCKWFADWTGCTALLCRRNRYTRVNSLDNQRKATGIDNQYSTDESRGIKIYRFPKPHKKTNTVKEKNNVQLPKPPPVPPKMPS